MESFFNSTSKLNLTSVLPKQLGRHQQNFNLNDVNFNPGSLWALVTSFSSLSDWVRIFLLGGVLETTRRGLWRVWNYFLSMFYLVAQLEVSEPSYQWMMVWLADRPSWNRTRSVIITSPSYDDPHRGRLNMAQQVSRESSKHERPVAFQPMWGSQCSLWYKGSYIRIARRKVQNNVFQQYPPPPPVDALVFTIFFGGHNKLLQLLQEAKTSYKSTVENRIRIWSAGDSRHGWSHAIVRPKRSLKSVVLDREIKEIVLSDAKEFLDSEKWYSERGIPWRRGYLLHGCPGSGKTSLIHAIAGELDLDIYVISLSKREMDDSILTRLVSSLPAKSIALIEDIDVAFTSGINRDSASAPEPENSSPRFGGRRGMGMDTGSSSSSLGITLGGLLNAIDGVAAQEGRILFATTNSYSALDPALRRPGRLDLHMEFRYSSQMQAAELFKRFYPANLSETNTEPTLIELAEEKINLTSPPSVSSEKKPTAHSITASELASLATEFSRKVPEGEFSMAAIQGHLMRYKTMPRQAVAETLKWVETERKQKKEWEGEQAEKSKVQETGAKQQEEATRSNLANGPVPASHK